MGTVPLVESILDIRNVATAASYLALGATSYAALITENRQQAIVLIMVRTHHHRHQHHLLLKRIHPSLKGYKL